MTDNSSLNGQSRSRRTARPYVLAIVALGVLIAIIVGFAQPRETRDGATSPVAPDANISAASPSASVPDAVGGDPRTGEGRGTREVPDAGPPLDSKATSR